MSVGAGLAVSPLACDPSEARRRALESVAGGVDGAVGLAVSQCILGHAVDGPHQPTGKAGQEWQVSSRVLSNSV